MVPSGVGDFFYLDRISNEPTMGLMCSLLILYKVSIRLSRCFGDMESTKLRYNIIRTIKSQELMIITPIFNRDGWITNCPRSIKKPPFRRWVGYITWGASRLWG
jgi:hypothetical protein